MSTFVPRAYQSLIIDHILQHERCSVFASPGSGKTSSTIEAVCRLMLFGEVSRVLVLAPKRVAEASWPDELVKWRDSFGHLRMAVAIGSAAKRKAAIESDAHIVAINYENIEWLVENYGENWPFDMIVADESSRLKSTRVSIQRRKRKDGTLGPEFLTGRGSVRGRALARVAFSRTKRWVGLTGSPAPNGLQDVWAGQFFVDRGARLGQSFDAFTNRWFRPAWGSTQEQQRFEPLPFAEDQIQALLAQTALTIDARDWFNIKAPIERHVMVDLPPKARQAYDELQKELFTYIDEHPVEVFSAGTKMNKTLQVANGSVIVDKSGNWSPIHDEKIEALKSIVEEMGGESILVAYQYKADCERILKAFPKAKTLDYKGAQREFETGKLPMLVVHPKSAGHGLSLQHHCRCLVDYSSGFNLEEDEQVIERVGPTRQAQIGQNRAVYRYRIVARDTLEETAVLPALSKKMSVQDALKNAMKNSR